MTRRLGEISLQVLHLAGHRELTYADAASTLQLSRRDASVAVYSLAARGHLEEVDRRMVPGARKPVPVYRASAQQPAESDCPTMMMLDWPR
jgi:hypothetical protein